MNYLGRIKARISAEGYARTFQYGAMVGADIVKACLRDAYLDLTYSGRLLGGNQTSAFSDLGANDVYHTDYSAMPLIFRNAAISPDDVLVDVGCGKGRVINYWLSTNPGNRIYGLELDPALAAATARQFASRANVRIIAGDAVENLPPEGTVFYFYNPFSEEKVRRFEQKLKTTAGAATVIYYNPKSLPIFANPDWSIQTVNFEQDLGIKRWGRLNKYHDLAVITRRQS